MNILSNNERRKIENFILKNKHDDFVNRKARSIITPFWYRGTSISKIEELPELVLLSMAKWGTMAHLRNLITSEFIKHSFEVIFNIKKHKEIMKCNYPDLSFNHSIRVCDKAIYYKFKNEEIEFFISKKTLSMY